MRREWLGITIDMVAFLAGLPYNIIVYVLDFWDMVIGAGY